MGTSQRVPHAFRGPAIAVVALVLLATVVAAAALSSPTHAPAPSSGVRVESGSSQQWAFGGTASSSYSCSQAACFGGVNVSSNLSLTLSYRYYIAWAVIYTQTNVSATQTMIEGQAAVNASLTAQVSECFTTSAGAPCNTTSVSVSLAGLEQSTGFSNITLGAVDLTPAAGGTPALAPALAIENAQSNDALNFSGSYSVSGPSGTTGGPTAGTLSFDVGGSESSSIAFSTPLGLVPLNPQAGDTWTASAPYTATGSYSAGYSLGYDYGSYSYTDANWTTLNVAPSGTLFANGTDLGAYTLYDNYTSPPTSVTAQLIAIDFGSGAFTASDGWLMAPSGLYGGLTGALSGAGGSTPLIDTPRASLVTTTVTTGESAYYEPGSGFVGAQFATNTTGLSGTTGGATTPSLNVQAGPEPVSVAQSQYRAILTGNPGGGSNWGTWLLLAAVVVVVVLVVAGVLMVRRARRRPPRAVFETGSVVAGPSPPGPATPSVQGAIATPPSLAAPPPVAPPAPATPVCPSCGQPGMYVDQYQRYYCYRDQRYL